jgi:hypothetical protein
MTTQDPLEGYIFRLRSALSGMTVAEREDIVEEIRTHVHERIAESGLSVTETLARLGSAEELAAAYGNGALVRRVRSSFSPWLILRAAYAWGMTGVHGILVFYTAVIGYALGLGFLLCGLLKPLFPEETGLWVGPGVFEFGFYPRGHPEAQQILGPWFTQIALALSVLFFIGTTMLMQRLLPRFNRWRTNALHPGRMAQPSLQQVR